MTAIYHTTDDINLQLRLLRVLPAWSSRLGLCRKRLASAYFYKDACHIRDSAESVIDLELISNQLQSTRFNITNATDFGELAAVINVLNIAIGCGDYPSPCNDQTEAAFNTNVDILAMKVNSMFNAIIDTGASHMKRTEAKEVLEGFQRRLEYAVRTRPKPKRLIFGGTKIVPMQDRMKAFLDSGTSHESSGTASGLYF